MALTGPCWRCTGPTTLDAAVDSWEYQEDGARPGRDEDGLDCVYLDAGRLELAAWLRDALVDSLPDTILCRPDCAGLCGGCGVDLNHDRCRCAEPEPDPRWAPLADLARRLEDDR